MADNSQGRVKDSVSGDQEVLTGKRKRIVSDDRPAIGVQKKVCCGSTYEAVPSACVSDRSGSDYGMSSGIQVPGTSRAGTGPSDMVADMSGAARVVSSNVQPVSGATQQPVYRGVVPSGTSVGATNAVLLDFAAGIVRQAEADDDAVIQWHDQGGSPADVRMGGKRPSSTTLHLDARQSQRQRTDGRRSNVSSSSLRAVTRGVASREDASCSHEAADVHETPASSSTTRAQSIGDGQPLETSIRIRGSRGRAAATRRRNTRGSAGHADASVGSEGGRCDQSNVSAPGPDGAAVSHEIPSTSFTRDVHSSSHGPFPDAPARSIRGQIPNH